MILHLQSGHLPHGRNAWPPNTFSSDAVFSQLLNPPLVHPQSAKSSTLPDALWMRSSSFCRFDGLPLRKGNKKAIHGLRGVHPVGLFALILDALQSGFGAVIHGRLSSRFWVV
jgi:hypothetical protein